MDIFRTAYVYVRNDFAGLLCETDEGYSFSYNKAFIKSSNSSDISLTMPIRKEPYKSNTLFSFFDGLIPEGWLLDEVCQKCKMEKDDRFGILFIACKDCVGNVTIRRNRS